MKKIFSLLNLRMIFKNLEYNLEYFGQKQIDSIVQRIKKGDRW
jgi:hypothetical protein